MQRVATIIGVLAILSFALDQLSKFYVTDVLGLGWGSQPYDVFAPYLRFVYAENEGINFGIPLAGRWVLIGLSVAISLALLIWSLRRNTVSIAVGAGLVIGGALGNAWDRLIHGAVIDFLNTSCCGINNPFSFNIADIAIFAGAIWIAIRA
ncbi:MAG: signal peptidase II [Pseudomonadota bacterium]